MGAVPGQSTGSTPSQQPSTMGGTTSTIPKKKYTYSELTQMGAVPGGAVDSTKEATEQKKGSTLGNIFKTLAGAPATMIARPVQLAAELIMPGDNTEALDKFSKEKLGGLVAPIPKNNADVKKDAGRAIQTVAYGMPGLVSGGAAFGAGASLEQGNDLFSAETAFQTVLGAGGAKVLGFVGKPLLDATGKVIGKITPEVLKDVASKGTKAITDFAKRHEIMGGAFKPLSESVTKNAEKFDDSVSRGARALFPKSKNLLNRSSGLSGSDVGKFKQQFGETPGEYLERTGNFGNPTKTAEVEVAKHLKSIQEADNAFAQLPGEHKNPYTREMLKDLLQREGNIGVPGPKTQRLAELARKNEIRGLSHSEINEVKRMYERDVKLEFKKQGLAEKTERATRIDNKLREWQRAEAKKLGYKNIEDVNRQTQQSKFIADKIGKNLSKEMGASPLSLTETILLAGGTPETASMFFLKKLFSSKSFLARSAKALSGKEAVPFINAKMEITPQPRLPAPGKEVAPELATLANNRGAVEMGAPKSKPVNKFENDMIQNMRIFQNTKMLPAPTERIITPNTGGTPNILGRPYSPGGESPAIGGTRQRIFKGGEMISQKKEIAKRAADLTKKNGGVTINLNGDIPEKGYAYSPYKDVETIIPQNTFSDSDIDNFIEKYYDRLVRDEHHLGVWVDEGKVYVDISKVSPNENMAVEDALKNDQLGLFDLSTFETKYIKDYEKTNNTYIHKRKDQRTD